MFFLWDELTKDAPDEDVPIKGAVNLNSRPISEYEVKLAYGDLTMIIAMIRDYIKGLDQMCEDGDLRLNRIEYEAYYRKKYLGIAERISEQIEYDYDKQLEKCLKKANKVDNSDIGEEAIALTIKRSRAAAEAKQKTESEKPNEETTNEE